MAGITINGSEYPIDARPGRSLLDVLREDLRLTGAKYGCGEGECGACTVLVNGNATRACITSVDAIDGEVTTIEGLADERRLHPVQAAFVAARSLQCGYCTPGMVLSAAALLEQDPTPGDAAIQAAMAGNICRCGGYPRILQAIREAAGAQEDLEPVDVPASPTTNEPGGWTIVLPPMDGDRDWGRTTPGGARLIIGPTGLITAFTGKVDAGQGNRTAFTRMVAAELTTATSQVRIEMGDTATAPHDLGTFGSRSTPDAGHALRLVAAAARRELLQEAARRLQADPADLQTIDGAVHDPNSDRELSYGTLVADDSRTVHVDPDEPLSPAPQGIADVDPASLRDGLIAAVTGMKQFPSDLAMPDMLHGKVLRPPSHGAVLRSLDSSAARQLPGVSVVEDGEFVAVAAPTKDAATAAVHALRADWETTPQPAEADLEKHLRTHLTEGRAAHHETGDVDAACAAADICLEATYTAAYIAHVPLEPRAALAHVDGDRATVWVGTQRPFAVRDEVAAALGLAEEKVRVVVPDFGGGFGGKHWPDVAVEAARLAQATGRPVKIVWTREEEFSWAYLRPAAVIDVRGAASREGELVGWEFTNINSGGAGLASPYDAPNRRERFQPADSPLPQGSYRGLAATANNFARESHLDELATALRIDPVEFRLRNLPDARLRDVLTAVANKIGWSGRTTEPGRGLGIACGVEKDGRVAAAAEVTVDADERVRVLRICTAFECGAVIDQSGLRNQVIGATVMGLGGALFEAIHFDGGRVLNASMVDYRVPRFPDIPPIDVMVIDRADLPAEGAGEAPIIAVAPAIGNAIRAATGRRIRSLPMAPEGRLR